MNWVAFAIIYIFILLCIWGIGDAFGGLSWSYKILFTIAGAVITYLLVLRQSED